MEEKFSSWLVKAEGKLEVTGRSYSQAINRLSEHYSSFTGNPTDIYSVDQEHLVRIKNDYNTTGRFSEKGHETHGLYRAAIKAFYRFRLSNPQAPTIERNKTFTKPAHIKKKPKSKNYIQKIIAFFKHLFRSKNAEKSSTKSFVGTKKRILKQLLPLLPTWEKEVHEKYLIDNPRCERCKSMEFPKVVEEQPVNSKNVLKTILKDLSEIQKQSVIISDLEIKYKSQYSQHENKLLVLCRTCNEKEEKRKIERYPHEVPPIMRKGPPELRY